MVDYMRQGINAVHIAKSSLNLRERDVPVVDVSYVKNPVILKEKKNYSFRILEENDHSYYRGNKNRKTV